MVDENENVFTNDLVEANFNNCIIYGNDNPEVILEEENSSAFNFKFTNCLIRFQNTNNAFTGPNYNFNDADLYDNCIFNQEPDFLDTANNMLIIGDASAANGEGSTMIPTFFTTDILNVTRTSPPDIGAYQHVTFDED